MSESALIRLRDYHPPAWRVNHVEIAFDLDLPATEVDCTLSLAPDPEQASAELVLDGEELELLAISIDGVPLAVHEYGHANGRLIVPGARGACRLRTRVRIRPDRNTRLEGLYASRGLLLTQCEAEGFRRITFFIDRPDVMPTWRITLRAERARFPVLLGNGNPVESFALEDARQQSVWDNPHPTPCYLFALVAGELDCVARDIVAGDGRSVRLAVWAAPTDVPRCAFALDALERALRWDEQRFGRHYDLSQFNIVAAQDFTMGAMENKGLNIFNARFILADRDTATDADYLNVESVIGHEYFHNWSGNRVTLRDWFQLSLKEGLTVFRDQEFTADAHSRAVKRIEDVRLLRARQFAEDAGALAHPVRPAEYREINNFYTLTVYEKGAEIVRMLHTLLGEATFRAGMDRYFASHDGRAATVEDFLAAHAAVCGRDLSQFARWYAQPGTPQLQVRGEWADGAFRMRIEQSAPTLVGHPAPQPLHLPLRYALYDAQGNALDALPVGHTRKGLLELTEARHELVFEGLHEAPLPAFNQGFAAPVKLHYEYRPAELARLARIERDPFNRWDALQQLALGVLLRRFPDALGGAAALSDAFGDLLDDVDADPAFVAECLALPDFDTLADAAERIDVDALLAAREDLLDLLAEDHIDRLQHRYETLAASAAQGLTAAAIAARALRNACLGWITRLDPEARLASAQYATAEHMTDRLGALRVLVRFDAPAKRAALAQFQQRYRDDALVTDKWITLVASRPQPEALDDVRALLESPWWTPTNPNRVRAVLGSFARLNPVAFHRADGAGYALLVEQLPRLDTVNPQVAARLIGAFENHTRLIGPRAQLARTALTRLRAGLHSRDAQDLLNRLLA